MTPEYLAGLFDGKGHIEILPNKTLRVGLRVAGDVPKKLVRKFGGSCFMYIGKPWFRIQGEKAVSFLEYILPHVQVTKNDVKTALNVVRDTR